MIGVAIPPIAALAAVLLVLCWAFEPPDLQARLSPVKWSAKWWKRRYHLHLLGRRIWYFGKPPKEEDWLSGWRNYIPEKNAYLRRD